MTSRSRRNNRISSACGIESILIESFFPCCPENLSDPECESHNDCEARVIESMAKMSRDRVVECDVMVL